MLVRDKINKYLVVLQVLTFWMLILEIAFVLYPQHPGWSVGLFVLAGFLGLSVCLFGLSSVKQDLRSSIMMDFVFILLLLGVSLETDWLGICKWIFTLTALVFLFTDLGRGIIGLGRNGKKIDVFNKFSNLLMLIQILMVNILAVVVITGIFNRSKIVAIVLYLAVTLLFFTKELRFFNLHRVWRADLKKELRCVPLIDVCAIVSFIYYCGYTEFSLVVVPIVFFFLIDLIRNFIEKKKV